MSASSRRPGDGVVAQRTSALRARAEALLAGRAESEPAGLPPEVRSLLHDLSVHQIELEIQNEELREAQQVIGRARDDYARLYHQAPVGYVSLDASAMILQVNHTLAGMLDARTADLVGTPFADHLVAADRDVFHARYRAFFHAPADKTMELRLRAGKGGSFAARLTGRRDSEPGGGGAGEAQEAGPLLLVVHDVTEVERATEALRAERELLGVTLGSISDALIATDVAGHVTLMNPVAEALTGVSCGEAAGQPLDQVLRVVDEGTRQPCPILELLSGSQPAAPQRLALLAARSGAERVIGCRGAPIRDREDQVVGTVLVLRDVTEEVRLQRELQQVAKLDSLGVMAAGIAHDFNNLLTAIAGNIGMAEAALRTSVPHEAVTLLGDAEAAAIRARGLTRQLLTFAKGGLPAREAVAVLPLVREAVSLALTGSRSRCEVETPGPVWSVSADPGLLSQVLHNVLLNADQAMPDGGRVRVSISGIQVEAGTAAVPAGRYVRIVVADQGVGIPPEIQDRIFDPFFTTKQRGSGLGLASAHSIVRNHGGHISAASVPGKGSEFVVLLPALPDGDPGPQARPSDAPAALSWRVLVLDDEPLIARLAQRLLAAAGHEVTTVADGASAISCWKDAKQSGRPFHLAILDLTIPGGIGGVDVVAELRRLDPDVLAVASSGYSTDPVMAHYRTYGFAARLPKPYSVRDLRDLVARFQGVGVA